ncbi:MAG TPA: hypothetical protein DIW64_16020 [Cellvibrio sp.]|nr:hypothetical protein [Cellvibrio sp.]
MSASEFDIIFRGDIVFGHQLAEVKAKLQQLFKTDAAKVDALFTGRPVPLKRNLDEATANKYRDALIKAGAMVEICSSDTSPANAAPKPAPVPRRAAEAAPPVASGWTLAPLGSDLLPAKERPPQPAPVSVDISGLSLRAAEGNLVDASEVHEEISVQVIAPDLGLAAVGTDLISADEKLELPLVEIELEDWDIAEAGSDLLTEDERPIVLPAIIEVGDYGLAPAGSDLGQLKPNVKPLTPDISGLRLADSGN